MYQIGRPRWHHAAITLSLQRRCYIFSISKRFHFFIIIICLCCMVFVLWFSCGMKIILMFWCVLRIEIACTKYYFFTVSVALLSYYSDSNHRRITFFFFFFCKIRTDILFPFWWLCIFFFSSFSTLLPLNNFSSFLRITPSFRSYFLLNFFSSVFTSKHIYIEVDVIRSFSPAATRNRHTQLALSSWTCFYRNEMFQRHYYCYDDYTYNKQQIYRLCKLRTVFLSWCRQNINIWKWCHIYTH